MYKKHIKYVDFDENSREEDFYFNLTEAEVAEMELRTPGGLNAKLERITQRIDHEEIVDFFKDLIRRSYGVKTPDGRGFDKSEAVVKEFMQTQAYSDLFIELASDSKAASEFFNSIMPKKRTAAPTAQPAPAAST